MYFCLKHAHVLPPARPLSDLVFFPLRPPPETFRNQQKATNDRPKPGDGGALLNQENRRPPHDRNGSRNSASMPHFLPRAGRLTAGEMPDSRTHTCLG